MNKLSAVKLNIICLFVLMLFYCLACTGNEPNVQYTRVIDIPVPPGFHRIASNSDNFAHWLRQLPLKTDNRILFHDGTINNSHTFNILAVINKPLYFRENTEECVDFAIRLWADYHYESSKLSELYVYNNEGSKVYYSTYFQKYVKDSDLYSKNNYVKFIYSCMTAINPCSVSSGGTKISTNEIKAGDCIIQDYEHIMGHTSLIIDECINDYGDRLFLIGFGYTPAQEFHIEKASSEFGEAGWFTLEKYLQFLELNYSQWGKPVLIRL